MLSQSIDYGFEFVAPAQPRRAAVEPLLEPIIFGQHLGQNALRGLEDMGLAGMDQHLHGHAEFPQGVVGFQTLGRDALVVFPDVDQGGGFSPADVFQGGTIGVIIP